MILSLVSKDQSSQNPLTVSTSDEKTRSQQPNSPSGSHTVISPRLAADSCIIFDADSKSIAGNKSVQQLGPLMCSNTEEDRMDELFHHPQHFSLLLLPPEDTYVHRPAVKSSVSYIIRWSRSSGLDMKNNKGWIYSRKSLAGLLKPTRESLKSGKCVMTTHKHLKQNQNDETATKTQRPRQLACHLLLPSLILCCPYLPPRSSTRGGGCTSVAAP